MLFVDGQEVSRSEFMKALWADAEYAKKQSESHKGKPSGSKGTHHSEEAKEKNRQAQAGYETCVIWENELQNLDHVIGKLNRFLRI